MRSIRARSRESLPAIPLGKTVRGRKNHAHLTVVGRIIVEIFRFDDGQIDTCLG